MLPGRAGSNGGGCPRPGPLSRGLEHQDPRRHRGARPSIRLIASPGQRNDIAFAHDLIDGIQAEATIADKGYDADHLAGRIVDGGSEVVIPPKRNRKHHSGSTTPISIKNETASNASSTG